MAKKKKAAYRRRNQNRFSMFLVSLVVVMMLIVVAVKSVELNAKNAVYTNRINELNAEIEAEKERTEEIEEYRKYTQTKKYIEEMAKEKLGLVYENEILIKEEK